MGNTFDSFGELPEKLQLEALREGEILLQVQLSVATAADQRALTWSGFLITGATAALGGALALLFKTPPAPALPYVAMALSFALFAAAAYSVSTVAPAPYCLPGNRPGQWLPDAWECVGSAENKLRKARQDQAEQMDRFIQENRDAAARRAERMLVSFRIAFYAVFVAWVVFLTYLAVGR